jgi:sugar/nucleoside kinase (ribokinase family)
MRMIGIGDNVCDKYRSLGMMFPGGQALNLAVYCRQLGWESAYLGVFGRDAVGSHVQKTLDELGIDRSRCREYDGENGYALVDLVNGDRVFVMSNKGGVLREHPLVLDADDLAYIGGFDLIHTSCNSYLDPELYKLAPLRPLLSYDFSYRWNERDRWSVCPYLDVAFLSCSDLGEEEAKALLREMQAAGCGLLIATMGSRGALCLSDGGFTFYQPPLVDALDTLGAGDSFAAGFLTGYLNGCDILSCMQQGAALAARTCMVRGAFGHGTEIV